MSFVIKTSDGSLIGPFSEVDDATNWVSDWGEEDVGDYCVEELYPPNRPEAKE